MKVFIFALLGLISMGHDQVVVSRPVFVGVIEHTIGRFTISSSSATFLDIPFQALWERIVYHESDVLLVYAEAKRDGGYYDLDLVLHPAVLNLLAFVVFESGMIIVAFDCVVFPKGARESFTLFPGDTIDDPALPLESLVDELGHVDLAASIKLGFVSDFVIQVRPIITRLEK